jgi:hypothetical protein
MHQEGSKGIRKQGSRQQLRLRKEVTTGNSIRGRSRRQELGLRSKRTYGRFFGKTIRLEIVK